MTIRSRLRVWLLLGPAAFVCHIGNASSAIEVIVSVPDQTLALLDQGKLIARYRISTSKFGIGDSSSSYRTPLGTLFVSAKYGDHLPAGSVIKNRAPTGEIVNADARGRDAIVSRVIWLRGMESQNQFAHDRCIYIHGTPEERRIGKPASFGCVRMRSRDIIALYDRVHIGMHVTITRKPISDFLSADNTWAVGGRARLCRAKGS